MKLTALNVVLWIFAFQQGLHAYMKYWIPTTSIVDKQNWARGQLPQRCDRLLFQNADDVTLLLPSQTTIETIALTLSRKGILVLGQSSVMSFTSPKNCTGYQQNAEYLRVAVKGWLDPDNWHEHSNVLSGGWVPHRSRIPCSGDAVVFAPLPQNKSGAVTSNTIMLPSVLIPIAYVVLGQRVLNSSDWSDFLQSEEGYEHFKGPADIRALEWRTAQKCLHWKKCFCGQGSYVIRDWSYSSIDSSVLDEAVCLYARPRCDQTEILCHSPVYPEGHCCGVCGALVNIHDQTEEGIPLITVGNMVRLVLQESNSKIKYYVGRLPNGNIQIVLISENGDSSESYQLAHIISSDLHKENFGSLSVSLTSSGSSKEDNPVSNIFGIFFGSLIFVISLFGTVYYVLNTLPKQKWFPMGQRDPFTFARFRNNLQETVSEESLVLEAGTIVSDSFANPLFNPDNTAKTGSLAGGLINDNDASSTKDDTEKLIQLEDIKGNLELTEASCVSFPDMEPESNCESDGSEASFSQLHKQPETVLDDE